MNSLTPFEMGNNNEEVNIGEIELEAFDCKSLELQERVKIENVESSRPFNRSIKSHKE